MPVKAELELLGISGIVIEQTKQQILINNQQSEKVIIADPKLEYGEL
ncbi:hypothetical protein [Lactococcus lactis]|nr:hypothetical protein [Lactococcus lactis]